MRLSPSPNLKTEEKPLARALFILGLMFVVSGSLLEDGVLGTK